MPIDSSIALAIKPPQINTPAQTMGQLYQMRHAKQQSDAMDQEARQREQQIQEGGQKIQENTLNLQQKTNDAADEAAINEELKNIDQTDPQGLHKVGDRLRAGNHGRAAMKYDAGLLKSQRDSVMAQKEYMDTVKATHEVLAGMLVGVTNEISFQTAKGMVHGMVQDGNNTQALAAFESSIPSHYDETWVNQAKEVMSSVGEHATDHRMSLEEQHWMYEHGQPDKNGNLDPKAVDIAASSLGRILAHTKSDTEWQQALKGWMAHNHTAITKAVLPRFGTNYSPQNAKDAADATLTEEQLRRNGFTEEEIKETGRFHRGEESEREAARKDRQEALDKAATERRKANDYRNHVASHNRKYAAAVQAHKAAVAAEDDPDKKSALLMNAPEYTEPQSREDFDAAQEKPAAPAGRTVPTPYGNMPVPGGAGPQGGAPAAPAEPAKPAAPAEPAKPAPIAPTAKSLKLKNGKTVEAGSKVKLKDGRTVTVRGINEKGEIEF